MSQSDISRLHVTNHNLHISSVLQKMFVWPWKVKPWCKIPLKEIQLLVGPFLHQMWMSRVHIVCVVQQTLNTAILLCKGFCKGLHDVRQRFGIQ